MARQPRQIGILALILVALATAVAHAAPGAVTLVRAAGSPGTQSGVAVTDTTTMGASASSQSYASLGTSPSLSRTQARLLQRHEALR